jgi:GNAT superfamily N-acetyltransferase
MLLSIDTKVPHLFHVECEFVVNLYSNGYSGRCGLKKIGDRLMETHSSLHDQLQNKGFGIAMYKHAIQLALDNGYHVCSSHSNVITADAEYLWKSRRLREEYEIVRRDGRFWVVK